MLFIIANGAGPGSLDRRRQRQKKRPGREALASQNATSESRSFDDQPEPVEVGDVIDEEGR